MCEHCDCTETKHQAIFHEQTTENWYLQVCTDEWDNDTNDLIYVRQYIHYCPWCGRKLTDELISGGN